MSVALRLLFVALLSIVAAADEIIPPVIPKDWLVIEPVDGVGRRPVRPDAVFAAHLLERDAPPPEEGQVLSGERGEQRWQRRQADEDGRVAGPVGYAYTTIESDTDRVMIADARRALTVYVNGSAHMADLYGYGFGGVPVALKAGANHVYVHVRRGSGFSMTLREPDADLMIVAADTTAPDLLVGESDRGEAAILVMNATTEPMGDIRVESGGTRGIASRSLGEPVGLPPLGVTKLRLELTAEQGPVLEEPGTVQVPVTLKVEDVRWQHELELNIRDPSEAHRRTYWSPVDESVQEFAVRRPTGTFEDGDRPGLVLSLHGAGVDCLAQARAYAPKERFWIVAPTNRRPFGFDWQDWGYEDALLVGDFEAARNRAAPLYVTGHSMGGHGTWHFAVNTPWLVAAVAPSAGWPSFDTYGGRPDGALQHLWHAADGASHTLDLLPNLGDRPVYIIHGTGDDNVPPEQARLAEQALTELGHAPRTHYEEGAGHWWDGEASDGADCVDWPGVFEMFTETREWKRNTGRLVSWDVTRANQGAGVGVLQPQVYGERFDVRVSRGGDPETATVGTDNVRCLWVENAERYVLDGETFEGLGPRPTFIRDDPASSWRVGSPPAGEKRELWSGPFKRAFGSAFLLVYGTAGDAAENRAMLERARHDAQVWWYRGNGRSPILSDRDFLEHWGRRERHNVILYGNADTNAAWGALVGDESPIQVTRDTLRIGDDEWTGDDLGCVFVRPRADRRSLIGVVAHTGARGARLGSTLQYFVSGVGYPDYTAYSSDVLSEGDGGVLAAGWFDHAWNLDGRGYRAPER